MSATVVKIIVFVPPTHSDVVRKAMGDAGAGKIGKYSHCSFTTTGQARYIPQEGANPTVGQIGQLETVTEDRIEVICERERLATVIAEIKKVHPYEEVALDVYPIELI